MKFPDWLPVFGDRSYRGYCPHEVDEQKAVFDHIKLKHPNIELVAAHQRNEGKKTVQQRAREKREGMKKGASDIIVPGCPSFVCELKRKDHTQSQWKRGQVEYLEAAFHLGSFVCVALGYDGAIEALDRWIAIHDWMKLEVQKSLRR